MKLVIEIELGNDVFAETGLDEVARLLDSAVSRLPEDLSATQGRYSLHDANGNWVGDFAIVSGEINR